MKSGLSLPNIPNTLFHCLSSINLYIFWKLCVRGFRKLSKERAGWSKVYFVVMSLGCSDANNHRQEQKLVALDYRKVLMIQSVLKSTSLSI